MIMVTCKKHNFELDEYNRCSECKKESIEAYNEFAKQFGGYITTTPPTGEPESILLGGRAIQLRHDTDCGEYCVPKAIYDEIQKYIGKAIADFELKCDCLTCLRQRG